MRKRYLAFGLLVLLGYSYTAWREKWRRAGLKWSSEQKPPPHWNAAAQLKNVDK